MKTPMLQVDGSPIVEVTDEIKAFLLSLPATPELSKLTTVTNLEASSMTVVLEIKVAPENDD
jgi:hypothetical protein